MTYDYSRNHSNLFKIKIFLLTLGMFVFALGMFPIKGFCEDLVDSEDYRDLFPKEIHQDNFKLYKGALVNLRGNSVKDYVIADSKSVMQGVIICIYTKEEGEFKSYYKRNWVFEISDWYNRGKVD